MNANKKITAVLLAGGRATRMGGDDKGLILFAGEPLVKKICAALQPQVAEILINANRNHAEYRRLGHRIIPDQLADYQGPLAGMHAALQAIETDWLLTIPCDGPFVAADYAAKMQAAATAKKTRTCSRQRRQPNATGLFFNPQKLNAKFGKILK